MKNIAIIGGGAAGFFAAITAKKQNKNNEVFIFERSKRVLAKVAITGGGRCNVTNSFNEISSLTMAYPRGNKLLKRLFNIFDYTTCYQWFEEHGVKLITQADNCVFPQSQDAQSIVQCLVNEAHKLGVKVITDHWLENIEAQENGTICLHFKDKGKRCFDAVAITTGGSPRIEPLQYLAKCGHKIEQPVPSLFTFNINNKNLKELMGTVITNVSLHIPGSKINSSGALLITHWGISGPATLKLSSYAARIAKEQNYKIPIAINWTNGFSIAEVEKLLKEAIQSTPQKQISSIRFLDITNRVWTFLLSRADIDCQKKCCDLSKKMMNKLIETLTNDIYTTNGKGAFKEEFVTCGGVSLKSINNNTLESKHVPNLYFAGEVLDIDAITGGFNLQAAWTTGYVVGLNISKE
ncbi:MAG: NAD(P)/FAD-dependent oxidoreductase [Prevotella sp.]